MFGGLMQRVMAPAAGGVAEDGPTEGVLFMLGRERPRGVRLQDDVADVVVVQEVVGRAACAPRDHMARRSWRQRVVDEREPSVRASSRVAPWGQRAVMPP
jgi:hypothetical protein